LYGVGPMILVNVAGVDEISSASTEITVEDGQAVIEDAEQAELARAFLETVEIEGYTEGEDYIVSFDQNGVFKLSVIDGGSIPDDATLTLTYDALNFMDVAALDVIGGVDSTGKKTGLEAVSEVFPRFG